MALLASCGHLHPGGNGECCSLPVAQIPTGTRVLKSQGKWWGLSEHKMRCTHLQAGSLENTLGVTPAPLSLNLQRRTPFSLTHCTCLASSAKKLYPAPCQGNKACESFISATSQTSCLPGKRCHFRTAPEEYGGRLPRVTRPMLSQRELSIPAPPTDTLVGGERMEGNLADWQLRLPKSFFPSAGQHPHFVSHAVSPVLFPDDGGPAGVLS